MDMKIDSRLIKAEREKRAWSQEHLADVAGLGVRTVHRIENTGSASPESVKALASVFEIEISDLLVSTISHDSKGSNHNGSLFKLFRWPIVFSALLIFLLLFILGGSLGIGLWLIAVIFANCALWFRALKKSAVLESN